MTPSINRRQLRRQFPDCCASASCRLPRSCCTRLGNCGANRRIAPAKPGVLNPCAVRNAR